MELKSLDLNLLIVFDQLMEIRSVTGAARVLGVTQSTVSTALNRLRAALGERLLERQGNAMVPTRSALAIWPDIRASLRSIEANLNSLRAFDPARQATRLRLGLDEYSFTVSDPYDTFLGYGDVKVTSTFASDAPDRRGVSLLIIHGAEKDGWRSDKPTAKFLMINLPFKTVTVKRLALKKKTVLGIYMEEVGEGESTSSVLFWDGKKYKYSQLGSTLE